MLLNTTVNVILYNKHSITWMIGTKFCFHLIQKDTVKEYGACRIWSSFQIITIIATNLLSLYIFENLSLHESFIFYSFIVPPSSKQTVKMIDRKIKMTLLRNNIGECDIAQMYNHQHYHRSSPTFSIYFSISAYVSLYIPQPQIEGTQRKYRKVRDRR